MFSHTCSRCGKVWEMPVQLDTSRPIYCSECLPIIREEKKAKDAEFKTAKKEAVRPPAARTTPGKGKAPNHAAHDSHAHDRRGPKAEPPNRPRLLGDLSAILKSAKEEDEKDEDENGLLGQIMKNKHKPIEKNKDRLTLDTP
jgi:CxxC-x17-CxxC domain-containing protein